LELPARVLALDRDPEPDRVCFDFFLACLADAQRATVRTGGEAADAVQVGRVAEGLAFDQEAELLDRFELPRAILASTGGHFVLTAQRAKGPEGGALGIRWVCRQVKLRG
jgi:hypothetical protein